MEEILVGFFCFLFDTARDLRHTANMYYKDYLLPYGGMSHKESALANHPAIQSYQNNEITFEEMLNVKAKLVGVKMDYLNERVKPFLGKLLDVTDIKPHFTVYQLKQLVWEKP